jgi:hypothetical protein
MKELRRGRPSTVPRTLTRPFVPKKLTDAGQTTYVHPPLAELLCNFARNSTPESLIALS